MPRRETRGIPVIPQPLPRGRSITNRPHPEEVDTPVPLPHVLGIIPQTLPENIDISTSINLM